MAGILTLQGKIAATATPQELPANPGQYKQMNLTAKSTNTAPIAVSATPTGTAVDGTGTGYILEKGITVQLPWENDTNNLWVSGTAGDIYSIIAVA